MARILFLAHRIPYPPTKGDKIRSWHLFRHLAENHDVHLGCYVDDPRDLPHIAFLEGLAASVCAVPVSRWSQRLRALSGFLRGQPLTIAAYPQKRLWAYVDGLMARGGIDAVVLFSGAVAPLVIGRHDTVPVVADLVDVDSAKWAAYANEALWPLSWVYRREARLLGAYECFVAANAKATLFVSEAEAQVFRKGAGAAGTVIGLPNGVDLRHFDAGRYPERPPGGPLTIVFTGAMDYAPNLEAAKWFCRAVWPMVRKRIPEAQFRIAGGPTGGPAATLADAGKGIHVLGFVDDMAAEISAADIVVAPLLTARGIQNKVLEGMAMSKAVVATPAAHEGIAALDGRDILIADGADNFAAAVLRLGRDAALRQAIGRAGRQFVESQCSWDTSYRQLDAVMAGILKDPQA